MKQGKPPIGSDGFPMELHHKVPLAEGGTNAFPSMTFDELAEMLERSPSKSFGQGVSEAEIDIASAQLGVNLVGGYRRFLRRFGWGGVGSIELFGLGAAVPPYLNLTAMTRSEREEMSPSLPTHLIPLMNDGGGNLYCLESRVEGEPPVVFWDHAAGAAQQPAQVAPDFMTWLAERLEGKCAPPMP